MSLEKRILRADTLRHQMNPGKEAKVRAFVRDYRSLSAALGRQNWRRFFESGATNKIDRDKSRGAICGAAPGNCRTQAISGAPRQRDFGR
jgi:hypothetical protein